MIRRTPSTPRSARTRTIDVSAYRGQWIALDPKTRVVIGHGSTPQAATKKLAETVEPLLYFVSKSDAWFVGVGA